MCNHFFFFLFEQISTQQEDYLIDTIALHDAMAVLRPIFANASICKVISVLHINIIALLGFPLHSKVWK